MTEQPLQTYQDDEISLLDILVTLAESWRLLMFGPLIAGVVAGALSFAWPKTFESVAIVRLAEEEVALLHMAPPVVDALIQKFGLLAESEGVVDDARRILRNRLTYAVDKKTKLVTITTKGATPEAAQALGTNAITLLLKELQVKGQEKILLEKTIAINARAIEVEEDAMESIQHSLKKGLMSDLVQESIIKNLTIINTDIAQRSQENEAFRQKLEPKGSEVFVQQPSFPQYQVSPKRGLVILSAFLVSGLALMIFVFVRKAWASAAQEDEVMQKIALIKKAFQLK